MESSASEIIQSTMHEFISADGTSYHWEKRKEAAITLEEDEINGLRSHILGLSDTVIQNQQSGNGIPMGVKIPISADRLDDFLNLIIGIIKFKDKFSVQILPHAADRLAQDIINGSSHPDFRGWLSETDVHECVLTISQVNGARLTIDRRTLHDSQIKFNSSIALEVRGTKPDGTHGTLALAFIEERKIRIITLL